MRNKIMCIAIVILLLAVFVSGCTSPVPIPPISVPDITYSGYIKQGNPVVGGTTQTFNHVIFSGCKPNHQGLLGTEYYDYTINGQIYSNVNSWDMQKD